MIVKIIPATSTNITLEYLSRQYLCYNRQDVPGSTFQLGSATIVPTSTDDSTFVNEVEVSLQDQTPQIIDDNGNVYVEVYWYKQNTGITPPARV